MKHYIEAYGENHNQILGNLDGQGVIRALSYRRTIQYKALVSGDNRPKWSRIRYWRIVTEKDEIRETIYNRYFVPREK
jgi:hypothetical protein